MKIKNSKNPQIIGYLFIAPAFFLYIIFVGYPIIQVISFSFFKWTGPTSRIFVGLDNYRQLINDEVFWIALKHNIIWVILTLVFPLFFGLLLAAMLVKCRLRRFLSSIYFIPRTIPLVVSAIMWGWIYNPIFGLANWLLGLMGLDMLKRGWLAEPSIALYSLNVLGAWTYFGFCVLIYLAALQNISPELYEAASLDGATWIQQFKNITIPSVSKTTYFLSLYSILGAMRGFDLVHATTKGGPGYATEWLSTYIYKLFFLQGNYGYAASISVALLALVIIMTVSIIHFSNKEQISR